MSTGKTPTREQLLVGAIEKARIPARDYRVFRSLLRRATWGSAVIAEQWQPRSVRDIARDSALSVATVKRSLTHLEAHGWIVRGRADLRGRGHRTGYGLLAGSDCDCARQRPEPKSDAERARAYRQRKKLARSADSPEVAHAFVTQRPEVAQIPVTLRPESGSDWRDEVAQIGVTKGFTSRDEPAGQTAFSGRASVRGGGVEGETVACTVCGLPMHPVLPASGFRTHPCCDPGGVSPDWPLPEPANVRDAFARAA